MISLQNKLAAPFSRLAHPIGPNGRNATSDVRTVQRALANAGHFDLSVTGQADGYAGQRLIDGIMAYQKQAGLKEDGVILPNGPTEQALLSGNAQNLPLDKQQGRGVAPDLMGPSEKSEEWPDHSSKPIVRSERILKSVLYAIGGNDPRKHRASYPFSVGGIR